MFSHVSEEAYDSGSEGGTRYLFGMNHYEFHDTLDEDGLPRHFVLEYDEHDTRFYEVDRTSMYECMARYLAGEYEKREYEMEESPTHAALLDLLELATAKARMGDSDFTLDDIAQEELDEDDEGEEYDEFDADEEYEEVDGTEEDEERS